MNPTVELAINVVLAGLLTATVGYCWALNRRMKIIQDSRGELAQLLRHFDDSTAKASESIIALQTASKKIGETIQARIDKANYVMDDLTFLLERATKIADSLEAQVSPSRAARKSALGISSQFNYAEEQEPAPRTSTTRTAPQSASRHAEPAARESAPQESTDKTLSSLQAMLEKITSGEKPETTRKMPSLISEPATTAERSRSQTERELLQMIRNNTKV